MYHVDTALSDAFSQPASFLQSHNSQLVPNARQPKYGDRFGRYHYLK